MSRKIRAIDVSTGKLIEVDADKIKTGPIRQQSLPEPLLQRVKAIHASIKHIYGGVLEQFEIDFMRDSNPEKEVAVWERIVAAFRKVVTTMPDLDQKMVLRTLVAYSIDGLTPKEKVDPVVRKIIEVGVGKV